MAKYYTLAEFKQLSLDVANTIQVEHSMAVLLDQIDTTEHYDLKIVNATDAMARNILIPKFGKDVVAMHNLPSVLDVHMLETGGFVEWCHLMTLVIPPIADASTLTRAPTMPANISAGMCKRAATYWNDRTEATDILDPRVREFYNQILSTYQM